MPQEDRNDHEERIVLAAIAGDKEAFGRLYELYANQIFKYLYYRTSERSKAVDMTEIVFLKAWENLPGFGQRERGLNFRAWLFRMAHNLLVDYHRTKKEIVALDEISEQSDNSPLVHSRLEASEASKDLMDALGKLDENYRQVICLRFFSELSQNEIARAMGLSPGNVRVIQYRALRKLKEVLGKDDE